MEEGPSNFILMIYLELYSKGLFGGGGPNPTLSCIYLDVVADFIFFTSIARSSH